MSDDKGGKGGKGWNPLVGALLIIGGVSVAARQMPAPPTNDGMVLRQSYAQPMDLAAIEPAAGPATSTITINGRVYGTR